MFWKKTDSSKGPVNEPAVEEAAPAPSRFAAGWGLANGGDGPAFGVVPIVEPGPRLHLPTRNPRRPRSVNTLQAQEYLVRSTGGWATGVTRVPSSSSAASSTTGGAVRGVKSGPLLGAKPPLMPTWRCNGSGPLPSGELDMRKAHSDRPKAYWEPDSPPLEPASPGSRSAKDGCSSEQLTTFWRPNKGNWRVDRPPPLQIDVPSFGTAPLDGDGYGDGDGADFVESDGDPEAEQPVISEDELAATHRSSDEALVPVIEEWTLPPAPVIEDSDATDHILANMPRSPLHTAGSLAREEFHGPGLTAGALALNNIGAFHGLKHLDMPPPRARSAGLGVTKVGSESGPSRRQTPRTISSSRLDREEEMVLFSPLHPRTDKKQSQEEETSPTPRWASEQGHLPVWTSEPTPVYASEPAYGILECGIASPRTPTMETLSVRQGFAASPVLEEVVAQKVGEITDDDASTQPPSGNEAPTQPLSGHEVAKSQERPVEKVRSNGSDRPRRQSTEFDRYRRQSNATESTAFWQSSENGGSRRQSTDTGGSRRQSTDNGGSRRQSAELDRPKAAQELSHHREHREHRKHRSKKDGKSPKAAAPSAPPPPADQGGLLYSFLAAMSWTSSDGELSVAPNSVATSLSGSSNQCSSSQSMTKTKSGKRVKRREPAPSVLASGLTDCGPAEEDMAEVELDISQPQMPDVVSADLENLPLRGDGLAVAALSPGWQLEPGDTVQITVASAQPEGLKLSHAQTGRVVAVDHAEGMYKVRSDSGIVRRMRAESDTLLIEECAPRVTQGPSLKEEVKEITFLWPPGT